jgi:antitoxin YefM
MEDVMPRSTTYSAARASLAEIWDRLEDDRDLIVIKRRGHEPMALLPAAEVESLMETAHLVRSPRNALRLLTAIHRALAGEGEVKPPAELKRELGLD